MRFIYLVMTVLILLLLHACSIGRIRDIDPFEPIELSENYGLIVGSVTATINSPYEYLASASFFYRKQDSAPIKEGGFWSDEFYYRDDESRGWLPSGNTDSPFQHNYPDPSLAGYAGRLFAIKLPVGIYELTSRIIFPGDEIEDHDFSDSSITTPVNFEVRSGRVTYIGNLNGHVCIDSYSHPYSNLFGPTIPAVLDNAERDIPLLMNKFPNLGKLIIVKEVINDDNWDGLKEYIKTVAPKLDC